jgi:hypothetical protein
VCLPHPVSELQHHGRGIVKLQLQALKTSIVDAPSVSKTEEASF